MSYQNKLSKYESKLNNLQKGGSDLSDAISANNLDEVRRLLTINRDRVNEVMCEDRIIRIRTRPIFFAKSVEMLQLLIEFGADINIKNGFGFTLLTVLCSNNLHELVLFLVNYGADISIINDNNSNIFDSYIFKSKENLPYRYFRGIKFSSVYNPIITTIYKLLLNKGAKINFYYCSHFYNFNPIPTWEPTNLTKVQDINELNLIKKNNMVLPALATQPETFNIDYVRNDHPTVKYSQYLKEAYNITEAEIMAMASEMAKARRGPLTFHFIAAKRASLAASAAPVASSPPANAGAGTGP